jgi:hypothetical protein
MKIITSWPDAGGGPRRSAQHKGGTIPVALGFRAGRGGSAVVGVAADGPEACVVLSTFLATAAEGDRLSLEPYHVAAELARGSHDRVPPEAAAAVAEGRKRQDFMATKSLADLRHKLAESGCKPAVAALLVNRAGWITDLLEYSLFAPEHPAVAEGLAVRDALRFALGECGIKVVEMDEKSLVEVASKELHLTLASLEARLKSLGATAGKPWRKEQKLACLSAWLAVAALWRPRRSRRASQD